MIDDMMGAHSIGRVLKPHIQGTCSQNMMRTFLLLATLSTLTGLASAQIPPCVATTCDWSAGCPPAGSCDASACPEVGDPSRADIEAFLAAGCQQPDDGPDPEYLAGYNDCTCPIKFTRPHLQQQDTPRY